jgi:hypothetical protein
MSITNKTPNLYLIMEQLGKLLPDDIKNKIILLLLGIKEKYAQIMTPDFIRTYHRMFCCGQQFEIYLPTGTLQYAIMCEIQIANFDATCSKKKTVGAIKNIKKYMNLLDDRFKQRYKLLF